MNAYELAEIIEDAYPNGYVKDAADMLREQADRIAELEKEIQNLHMDEMVRLGQEIDATPQTKPLSDEEIEEVEIMLRKNGDFCELHFARAIERMHGIK